MEKLIIFVCHGNICRSPVAQALFNYYASKIGLKGYSSISRGVSSEEEGNDIFPPMKKLFYLYSIPFSEHHAHKISGEDYQKADLIFCMDSYNYSALIHRFGDKKIHQLHSYISMQEQVDDPWYSGEYVAVFRQLDLYIRLLIQKLNN